jgi:hypothetical protein
MLKNSVPSSQKHTAYPLWTQTGHSLTHGAEPFLRSRQLCSHSRTSQHHAMKVYGEWRYSSSILDLDSKWSWVVSSALLPLYSRSQRIGSCVGPVSDLDSMDQRKICCSWRESNPGNAAHTSMLYRLSYRDVKCEKIHDFLIDILSLFSEEMGTDICVHEKISIRKTELSGSKCTLGRLDSVGNVRLYWENVLCLKKFMNSIQSSHAVAGLLNCQCWTEFVFAFVACEKKSVLLGFFFRRPFEQKAEVGEYNTITSCMLRSIYVV